MPSWGYQDDAPLVPVRVVGKEFSISILGLIDSGAKTCAMHEKLARAIGLEAIGKDSLRGFGGSRPFRSEMVEGRIEFAGRIHTVRFASIGNLHFPFEAPRIVLGRNLLNLFKVALDGPNKRITVEPGR
ncbi:MAG TPA: hypothetical protein VND40_00055 [Nitrososphaerales archaeon]|nr:hypothetical protein [Nitrososphaerales archaeon]